MIAKSKMPRQMIGRQSLKHAFCHRERKPFESETAQMRDLFLNGDFGRGTSRCCVSFASHQAACFTAATDEPFAILNANNPALVGHFGNEIEAKLFANDTGEEAAYRMLLPFSRSHYWQR